MGLGCSFPRKWGRYPPKSCISYVSSPVLMYLPCISSVFLPLYSVHSDVLYRCVSCMYRRCIVMYRSCAWCPRLCYYIDTCGGIDCLQYWTIQCRIQVSYMYQMYCESLGGNSVVSQLALMSARCLLASTACMRCGDTWIMCGSHNTRPTCGIRPKYILIHDQIHVSVRGVSSPNWGGIMTIPRQRRWCSWPTATW